MSSLSTLLLIIFFLIFLKRNYDKKFWVILLYLVASFLTDIFIEFKFDRFYCCSFFTWVEYGIFSYFFYLTFNTPSFKRLVAWLFPFFTVVLIYCVINDYKSTNNFDYLSSSFESILLIIISILFFYEQITNPEVAFLYSSKTFWIICAILIYMSATLFLFISSSLPSESMANNPFWLINTVATIIKNLLFGIAFSKPIIWTIDTSSHSLNKLKLRHQHNGSISGDFQKK